MNHSLHPCLEYTRSLKFFIVQKPVFFNDYPTYAAGMCIVKDRDNNALSIFVLLVVVILSWVTEYSYKPKLTTVYKISLGLWSNIIISQRVQYDVFECAYLPFERERV